MSSPERVKRRSVLLLPTAVLLVAGLAAASGCTVRPLYTDTPAPVEGTVTGSIGEELSIIAIKPPVNRVGQEVRNNLIFLFNGGKGEPANPRYTLALIVSSRAESTATVQVNRQSEP